LLILIAIILIAVNLRIAVTSVGALLDQVTAGLGLSPVVVGALTALPAAAFAVFGALTGRLSRRFGTGALLVTAVSLVALGQLARAATSSTAVFLVASAAALAGIAVANILLPVLVKQYFPDRIGPATAAYTTAMMIGGTSAAAASVPIAAAAGSWRVGLGVWALPGLLALVPVLAMVLTRRSGPALAHATR
jgi:CP family cyanate transporter-like MFS transporter